MPELCVADIPSIVVADLYPRGKPQKLHRAWDFGGDVIVEIFLTAGEAAVEYRVTKQVPGKQLEEVEDEVRVSWTYPHFGGRRAWIHCTRSRCGQRTNRLYLDGADLVCRSCAGIRYASKDRPAHERARIRADKIRVRLGGEPGPAGPLPLRPHGKHRRTFRRLLEELIEAEELAEQLRRQHLRALLDKRRVRSFETSISSSDVTNAQPSLHFLLTRALEESLRGDELSTSEDD